VNDSTAMRHALLGAPPEYLTPLERPTLEEARAWCHNIAATHYQSSHIALSFLPRRVRANFESIYAYCKVAENLGDEVSDPVVAVRLLDTWGAMLDECYDTPERSMHPVFVALQETIREHNPPRQLFLDLLVAFRVDQVKNTYESWEELLEYSHYSANPIGRLVLWISGYRQEALGLLSDKMCSALQLANLWQSVVEDAERGRCYIPAESMLRFGVDEMQITGRVFTPEFGAMVEELLGRTRTILREGGTISAHVDKELAVTLNLFRKGGEAILNGIAAQNYDVLRGLPVVSKSRRLGLLAEALFSKLRVGMAT
jgi:squalene synthase HpnC